MTQKNRQERKEEKREERKAGRKKSRSEKRGGAAQLQPFTFSLTHSLSTLISHSLSFPVLMLGENSYPRSVITGGRVRTHPVGGWEISDSHKAVTSRRTSSVIMYGGTILLLQLRIGMGG